MDRFCPAQQHIGVCRLVTPEDQPPPLRPSSPIRACTHLRRVDGWTPPTACGPPVRTKRIAAGVRRYGSLLPLPSPPSSPRIAAFPSPFSSVHMVAAVTPPPLLRRQGSASSQPSRLHLRKVRCTSCPSLPTPLPPVVLLGFILDPATPLPLMSSRST
jgi:hypothetical protein